MTNGGEPQNPPLMVKGAQGPSRPRSEEARLSCPLRLICDPVPFPFPLGHDAAFTVAQPLSQQRLVTDVMRLLQEMGCQQVLGGGRGFFPAPAATELLSSSHDPKVAKVSRASSGVLSPLRPLPGASSNQRGALMRQQQQLRSALQADWDVITCFGCDGRAVAFLLAPREYYVEVRADPGAANARLSSPGDDGLPPSLIVATAGGRQQSQSLSGGGGTLMLLGEHRLKLQMLRGLGWVAAGLPVAQWRGLGGGRQARVEMLEELWPS